MARLDPLLKALRERSADELVLEQDRQPVFRAAGESRTVSPRALSRSQIVGLLAELAAPLDAVKLKGGESVRFDYTLDGSGSFAVRVENGGRTVAHVEPVAVAEVEAVFEPEPAVALAVAVAEEVPAGAGIDDPATIPDRPAAEPQTPQELPPAPSAAKQAHRGQLEAYLKKMFEMDASDLHLCSGEVPMVRLDGEMARLQGEPVLDPNRAWRLLESIMPERNRHEMTATNDTDFAYEIPGVSRFRVNVFTDRKGMGAVFRTIPTKILTAEDLGLPAATLELCNLSKGLVLVTGPTGSGKSTTLAAMIDHVNKTRPDHIITIEDPIEFVHANQRCLVNQREVVTHTDSFKKALRAALREDPDIVLVGELRDLETIAIAIETAETGHLVFGTLHTTTAVSTVDRIIDQFPADRQAQIRTMLSESLRGVIAQTLLKKIGGGRVAALEILMVNSAISNLIREGKTFQIPSLMQTGKKAGMQLLNDVLIDLAKRKVVEPEEAYRKAVDKASFLSMARGANLTIKTAAESPR